MFIGSPYLRWWSPLSFLPYFMPNMSSETLKLTIINCDIVIIVRNRKWRVHGALGAQQTSRNWPIAVARHDRIRTGGVNGFSAATSRKMSLNFHTKPLGHLWEPAQSSIASRSSRQWALYWWGRHLIEFFANGISRMRKLNKSLIACGLEALAPACNF